ncbi:MAG: Obg family GTPase CgtA, partial [Clostridia bacterium]|nr:Obg family GTPase CgtA [Clostridia bacterium]
GHAFLRHIDRCRLLLHLVDIACLEYRDPVEDIQTINRELGKYSEELAKRPQIIVANNKDLMDPERVDIPAFESFVRENGWELFYVSAITGEGIQDLVHHVAARLRELPPMTVYPGETDDADAYVGGGKETEIRYEDGKYIVEGEWLFNLMGQINFDNYESLNYFQRVLRKSGVFEALEERGCEDGDTVSIYDFEFDFVK